MGCFSSEIVYENPYYCLVHYTLYVLILSPRIPEVRFIFVDKCIVQITCVKNKKKEHNENEQTNGVSTKFLLRADHPPREHLPSVEESAGPGLETPKKLLSLTLDLDL